METTVSFVKRVEELLEAVCARCQWQWQTDSESSAENLTSSLRDSHWNQNRHDAAVVPPCNSVAEAHQRGTTETRRSDTGNSQSLLGVRAVTVTEDEWPHVMMREEATRRLWWALHVHVRTRLFLMAQAKEAVANAVAVTGRHGSSLNDLQPEYHQFAASGDCCDDDHVVSSRFE